MENDTIYLTLLIPAYNEEKRIAGTLEGMIDYFKDKDFQAEILVVDDGSTDGTRRVVESYQGKEVPVRLSGYEQNQGKGFAIKTGMFQARGTYVLFADADMSTPIGMFERFEPLLAEGADVVIGTRKTGHAYVGKHQPLLRESMGKVFTWLSNRILGIRVSDFTCGFKCFHRRTIEPVFGSQRIYGWSYDTEILFIAGVKGFSIREVPVHWFNDEATRVKLWKNVFSCLSELFEIWNNNRKGLYV
ncbi:MAG: glycosyltransferase family 2 protein [Candidatus Glassbacteria bacterium]|nr:glycosyltransferase family 2 protein [Candidatus Glassbacteria bacterium]